MVTLEQYFAEWDPMDFIKDLDAPKDEYSLEAETVSERYKIEMTAEQVGELVYEVFVELIELDQKDLLDESIQRGQEMKSILSRA